jgi:2-hydroxy-6-oxonona-2,4-dienedioate hydrolase
MAESIPREQQGAAEMAAIEAHAAQQPYRLRSGAIVHWRRFGNGDPLVLLHGGHGNWGHWIRNIEALASIRTVWMPDLPGYGDSGDLEPGAGFDRLVAATLESLDGLVGDATPVDLAGFSFGGMVASALACKRPTGKLALVGSAGHGGPRRPHPALLNWKKTASAAERSWFFEFNLKAFMLHDPQAADALALTVYEQACSKARFRSKGIFQAGALENLLGQSGIAPLLLWGSDDVTAAQPGRFSKALDARGISHVFATIAGAGHWAQYEKADEVNARLHEWFAGTR